MDPKTLTESENNPNKHSEDQLKRLIKIIEYQGWRHPIIVRKETGKVVAGHGRLQAALKKKWKQVPVQIHSFESDEQAYAFMVSDNSIAAWADLDLASINIEVPSLGPDFDIDLLGIKDFVIEPADKGGNEDDVPGVPKEPISKRGNLYGLGAHRLLCGDATSLEDVQRLMNGEKADMVFTDPPYNLKFKYNSYDDDKSHEEYQSFCFEWFKNIQSVSSKQIITTGAQNLPMWMNIQHPKAIGIWIKKNWISGGLISNLQQWEPILFYGPCERSRASDLFEINRKYQEDVGESHTCPKQIELMVDILKHWANGLVLDVFLGSGSTLIACEKTNRKCFGMEIDPAYCDVIIARWENFTGQKAVKLN